MMAATRTRDGRMQRGGLEIVSINTFALMAVAASIIMIVAAAMRVVRSGRAGLDGDPHRDVASLFPLSYH